MDVLLSQSEENYLKSIFNLLDITNGQQINTNLIAEHLETKASSVTEMVKKLSDKQLVVYEKYKGCSLTDKGQKRAIEVIRKHRLWETFLVDKLSFKWDEVHEIAEQLEHIQSSKLTNRLSSLLNHPKFDPHGDPIPDENGHFPVHDSEMKMKDVLINQSAVLVKIGSDSPSFLKFLTENHIGLNTRLKCMEKFDFDDSIKVLVDDQWEVNLSKKVVKNMFVKLIK